MPTLQAPPPTLTAISPSSAAPGASLTVVLTGSNFRQYDANPTIDGKGVTIIAFSVKSATEMTVGLTIAPAAAAGERHLKVTTSGGTTEALTFEVVSQPSSVISQQSSVISRMID